MKEKQPLVSVIAICYNHSLFLVDTLNSIKNQHYENLEVLIVDSFSSDNSVELIKEYISSNRLTNWKLFCQSKPTSICENLNFALGKIRGKYYQVISCDDLIAPTKLGTQVALFASSPESVGLVYSDYGHIDQHGEDIKGETSMLGNHGFSGDKLPPSGYVFCDILGKWFVHTITCLISTDAARSIGGYDEKLTYEDTDFILRMARKYELRGTMDLLGFYRILENSFFRSRTKHFYLSTCELYLKHVDLEGTCSAKVKRLVSHYFDVLFLMDPQLASSFFTKVAPSVFDRYIRRYMGVYKASSSKGLALFFKKIFKLIPMR